MSKELASELFNVEFWINTSNGYDNRYLDIQALNEQEAMQEAKRRQPRGKNFKIYK